MLERIPPQNIEAEQAVVGSLFLDSSTVISVAEILRPEDFYKNEHAEIYRAILALNERNEAIDLLTVIEELRGRNKLEQVGGVTYVTTLANVVPTAANVAYYARIVAEKAILRQIIRVSSDVASRSYEGQEDADALLNEAEQKLMELAQRRLNQEYISLKDALLETFERLDRLQQNKGDVSGIPTGFSDLDRFLGGFQASDLVLLAARPAMGKTSLGINMALNIAVRNVPVGFFSLEMSTEQVVQRLLCVEAMVNQHKIRNGFLNEDDWVRLIEAGGRLAKVPIFIDDTPALSVMELRAKASRLKSEYNIGFLVVDYLQLMQAGRRTENRVQEISEISRSLKAIARELDLTVLALSQLSRSVEHRNDKRPMLSELRESGSLEQDSDLVLFIYRDEYYNPESEAKGIAEIIVAKHRNGPVGKLELGFLSDYTKFVNLEKEQSEPQNLA